MRAKIATLVLIFTLCLAIVSATELQSKFWGRRFGFRRPFFGVGVPLWGGWGGCGLGGWGGGGFGGWGGCGGGWGGCGC